MIKPLMAPNDWIQFDKYALIFAPESGRGAVVVGVSHLDGLLRQLLEDAYAKQPSLAHSTNNGARPSTFAQRISAAHELGFISEHTRADLDVMRKLRNNLAHEVVPASFSDRVVQEAIAGLNATRAARQAYSHPEFAADYRLQFMTWVQSVMFQVNAVKRDLQ
jgi:hypothetical protein